MVDHKWNVPSYGASEKFGELKRSEADNLPCEQKLAPIFAGPEQGKIIRMPVLVGVHRYIKVPHSFISYQQGSYAS